MSADDTESLSEFRDRLSVAPLRSSNTLVSLWTSLWPLLSPQQREQLIELPDPCLKHVESRARKEERARKLGVGFQRLVKHDPKMFVESLRLYPHPLCRTAEAIGPLHAADWDSIEEALSSHRMWSIKPQMTEAEFWEVVEELEGHRELPQTILDYMDQGRSPKDAPLQKFQGSLQRFSLREKLEKIRLKAYESLRTHH